jgi:hypothetical protein
MKRRHFIAIALFALLSLSFFAWRYWWMTRRAFIRLKLMKPPANLLRNADFSQSTIANIPDYWGTVHTAALPDFSNIFQIEKASPVKNARALRLQNPQANFELSLQSCATFLAKPKPYTFSIYLRSDVENFATALTIGWDGRQSIVVNDTWQRYTLTYTPHLEGELRQGFQVHISLLQQGNLWLAAPQLEEGEQATSFVTALMDDHPLPVFPTPKTDELILIQPLELPFADELKKTNTDARGIQINHPHRILMKDDTWFPVFGIAALELKEWQLQDIANQGFNTVALYFPALKEGVDAKKSIETILVQLDAAHRKGLCVLPIVTHQRGINHRQMMNEKIRFIQEFKHHPAILCWWLLDEPTQQLAYDFAKDGIELYKAVKQADPNHPVFINEGTWHEGDWAKAFLQSTDIVSMDMYPIGLYQNPLTGIAERLRLMNSECLPAYKPTAFWLQLYGNYDAPREPTLEEQRAMTYLVFIKGVRLIFYWSYKPMNPILWESLKPLFEEIKKLSEIINRNEARWHSTGTVQIQVHYALWEVGEKFYLIACNTGSQSVETKFEFEQIAGKTFTQYKSWFADSRKFFVGKRLYINFAPYEPQVIELW